MNIFLSYANEQFKSNRDALCESAKKVGFDKVIAKSPEDINKSNFWTQNEHILTQPRGAGYWLWKPYIILEQLKTMEKDDIIIYSDAGRTKYYHFEKIPVRLIEKVRNSKKGFLVGSAIYQHGSLKKWTKRDCLIIMNSDRKEILKKPLIQATWSIWTPTQEAFEFLESWIKYAEDERCLTDKENTLGKDNYPEFIDHRHDQSILTLLAYKKNAPYLDFTDTNLFNILNLRPNSSLAHNFLKRIDDVEAMIKQKNTIGILYVLVKSFKDLKRST